MGFIKSECLSISKEIIFFVIRYFAEIEADNIEIATKDNMYMLVEYPEINAVTK